jgi:hypothetical protein
MSAYSFIEIYGRLFRPVRVGWMSPIAVLFTEDELKHDRCPKS